MRGKFTRIDSRHRPGFDFVNAMQALCEDMIGRLPDLAHIDLRYVALATSQTRKNVSHGMYASLTPLRFAGGSTTEKRGKHTYRIQSVRLPDDTEALYILTFYLPRFMNTDFRQKLVTVFHELWHISPDFNGDLRRHPGRCYAHTHSQKEYDEQMEVLVDQYLAAGAPAALYEFLQHEFAVLHRTHGGVLGRRIQRPKLYPVGES
jgi:hypothetical protein